jgi:hypothetical protein
MQRYSLTAVAFLVAGCAMNPAPVPIRGDAWGIADLAGEWVGEYESPDTRRSGSITFKLEAGRDTAYGDVIMVPGLALGWRAADPEAWLGRQPVRTDPQPLFIRFVSVEGRRVSGRLEPYRSPTCDCLLHTTFAGERRGDRIEGTFVTRHDDCDMKPETGKWWAERRRSPEGIGK